MLRVYNQTLKKNRRQKIDRGFLFVIFLLVFFGILMVANASVVQGEALFKDKWFFAKQQTVWALIGVGTLFLFSKINYSLLSKITLPLFLVTIILLVLVLIPGVGVSALGSRRWLSFGEFIIQPSELAKLSLALFLAYCGSKGKRTRYFLLSLALITVLVVAEPDLGTSLVLASEGLAAIFIYGVSIFLLFPLTIFTVFSTFVVVLTSTYRKERLLAFLNAIKDPLSSSYHIRQVLFALGGGGILGVGLGQSRQKYLFLPEATNDSIFAIIAEEVGFVGASILVVAYLFLIFKGFKIASNASTEFGKILGVAITTWIGVQTLLNFSSMVALTPITGVPLPLVSYGGSSLVVTLAGLGILLNISKHKA